MRPEDLLDRAPLALDRQPVADLVGGRRLLVTGAGGTIGRELCAQLAALSPRALVLVENSEYALYSVDLELRESFARIDRQPVLCDIRDTRRLEQVFAAHTPELVFNAAALKHVPLVETNPSEGVLTNTVGARNVAEAALRHQALAMVQVSTDKAIDPVSAMGASKRLAETYCQALDLEPVRRRTTRPRFVTVRFGNVLGSSGSVVPLFERQLAHGGPLTVTHPEMQRYFLSVCEAVELVLQAAACSIAEDAHHGEIFVLDMGEPVRIVDIARRMIRLAGLRPDIDVEIEFTGLRPGERLDDELFDDGETPRATSVPGVLETSPPVAELDQLRRDFDRLAALARQHDQARVRDRLSDLVPTYAPSPPAARHRGPQQAGPPFPARPTITHRARPPLAARAQSAASNG